jgi:hypothetical protein
MGVRGTAPEHPRGTRDFDHNREAHFSSGVRGTAPGERRLVKINVVSRRVCALGFSAGQRPACLCEDAGFLTPLCPGGGGQWSKAGPGRRGRCASTPQPPAPRRLSRQETFFQETATASVGGGGQRPGGPASRPTAPPVRAERGPPTCRPSGRRHDCSS